MRDGILKPTSPFSPAVQDKEWEDYIKGFLFPVSRYNTCAFLESKPKSWVEYGLFDLLMEEFAGGDYLLRIAVDDNPEKPLIVRDHKYHSPKEYGCSPEIWRKREVRDSRPDLRKKWLESAVPLSDYESNYVCPEVLIPFDVPMSQIKAIKNR